MKEKQNSLIRIEIYKEDFYKQYTLRARIGIYIGCLIGLVELKFLNRIK